MARPTNIVSMQDKDGSGENKKHGFAYHEIQGKRNAQEDALAWSVFDKSVFNELTPEQIGQRLWSTYRNLNAVLRGNAGSTASTTIINGDKLITATLADTEAYAVIYDEKDNPVAVHRLNRRNHSLHDPDELKRINDLGRDPDSNDPRIAGLAVSRAFGDFDHKANELKKHGIEFTSDPVLADADINITDLSKIPINYKVQVITACDGFTEPLGSKSSKQGHESWLLECLQSLPDDKRSEADIARHLVSKAYKSGSCDNISVSVQTVKRVNRVANFYGMTGIYDGHGGNQASRSIASRISEYTQRFLTVNEITYKSNPFSVEMLEADFNRDNSNLQSFDLNSLLTPEVLSQKGQTNRLRLKIKSELATVNDPHLLKSFRKLVKEKVFNTPKEINDFRNDVIETIKLSASKAENKNDNYRLLAYLALLVTGVGIFAIIMDQVSRHSKATGNRYSFLRPEGAKALDKIEEAVKKLDQQDMDEVQDSLDKGERIEQIISKTQP